MVRIIMSLLFVSLVAATGFSVPAQDKEIQFFAGIMLLQSSTGLTPEDRAQKFRDLETFTGIKAAEAQLLLDNYRQDPEKWQKLFDLVTKFLNEKKLSTDSKKILPTVVQTPVKKPSPKKVRTAPGPTAKTQ